MEAVHATDASLAGAIEAVDSALGSVWGYCYQYIERDDFATVANDVHRMFHHDSTALTTRASGLGWTCAGLPRSTQELACEPGRPKEPTPRTAVTLIVSCILNSTDVCLSPSMRVAQFPCAEQG